MVPIGPKGGTVRGGKRAELLVMAELLRQGLDVYQPLVDDRGIDCIVRIPREGGALYYEIQIKGVRGYNTIFGPNPSTIGDNYFLIVAYLHDDKPDEYVIFDAQELRQRLVSQGGIWDPKLYTKEGRRRAVSSLADLAQRLESEFAEDSHRVPATPPPAQTCSSR
jgi:hypothetical protein